MNWRSTIAWYKGQLRSVVPCRAMAMNATQHPDFALRVYSHWESEKKLGFHIQKTLRYEEERRT